MKPISMTDFVLLEENYGSFKICFNYANFLRKSLELWMFVPCDEHGKVLVEPERWNDYLEFPESFDGNKEWSEFYAYEQAKERCLFDGFESAEKHQKQNYFEFENDFGQDVRIYTVEDLVHQDLVTLTPIALKQIGL